MQKRLKAVGIHDFEQLSETGAKAAWRKLVSDDPSVGYPSLAALEGALRGVRKSELPAETKAALQAFASVAKGGRKDAENQTEKIIDREEK